MNDFWADLLKKLEHFCVSRALQLPVDLEKLVAPLRARESSFLKLSAQTTS